MNDMYSSPLCAGTELKPGRHYKLEQSLDQAQEGRGLARVAEHPEPACVSPNQDPSVLLPPESATHLVPPRCCVPYLRRLPSYRALMPELLWTGTCMLPQCRWMSCCTSAGATQCDLVGGHRLLVLILADFVSMQVISNKLLPQH